MPSTWQQDVPTTAAVPVSLDTTAAPQDVPSLPAFLDCALPDADATMDIGGRVEAEPPIHINLYETLTNLHQQLQESQAADTFLQQKLDDAERRLQLLMAEHIRMREELK